MRLKNQITPAGGNPGPSKQIVLLAIVLALFLLSPLGIVTAYADSSYTVAPGDTLSAIALSAGTTVEVLAEINQIIDPNYLYVGQVLLLPEEAKGGDDANSPVTEGNETQQEEQQDMETGQQQCLPMIHVVSSGETLSGIATRYGVSLAQITAANQITNPGLIRVGEAIKIPGELCAEPLVLQDPFKEISWSPELPSQGDTVQLVVKTGRSVSNLSGTLGDTPFHFVSDPAGTTHTTWLGIPAIAEPGFRQVQLLIGSQVEQVLALPIQESTFLTERLYFSPETTQLLAPEITERENNILASVTAPFSKPVLWDGTLAPPLEKNPEIISPFGTRRAYNDGPVASYHGGTDYIANEGDAVYASATGQVVFAGKLDVRGNAVILDHGGGVYTFYCHLSEISVKKGDQVQQGDIVGLAGNTGLSTGPHLHWEMRVQGTRVDPARLLATG